MGGTNSDRRLTRHHQKIEKTVPLDMRTLRRLSLVRAGECVIDTVHWSIAPSSALEARLRVDLSALDAATATITVKTPSSGPVKQRIGVEALPCRYGGHRFYFVCPVRRCRSEVLYLVDGRWASRRAHGLTYATQSMGEFDRVRRRRRKLQARLHGKGLTPRPRGISDWLLPRRSGRGANRAG